MKVVVLGAGIIGTTSAYFLAKQGHEVTVIDRQDSVSMETSHANAGCLSYGFTSPWASPGLPFSVLKWALTGRSPLIINPNISIETIKFLYRMYKNCNSQSYEINKSRMLRVANYSQKALLEIETDFDFFYEQKKQGSLQLFWDSKEIDKTKKDIAILDKFNIKSQLLSTEDCIKIEPGLQYVKNKLVGGIQFMDDFTGNCYLFSNEVYKKCVEMGVNFKFNTEIKSLKVNNDKIISVLTDKDEFTADSYSVSLGSYSTKILSKIGIDIPIYPIKGYSITLPVLSNEDAPQSTIMDEKNKIAITRLGDRIRVAGMAHLTDFDKSLRVKSLDSLMSGLDLLFPKSYVSSKETNFWTGFRPSTPDGTPIIGPTPYNNLFLNTGHGTLGWTMSAGSGKLLANIISGKESGISSEGIDMSRYSFSNQTSISYG
ncbi:D-amino acid dehydrogenase small subunit [bacterium]|nr:D-amino acid dehydrogenase small subunit [bacterium]|tara:strand:+ start:1313 stop:2599 length:1287 start_codon:yes stop_codon:yes gene_type:complete